MAKLVRWRNGSMFLGDTRFFKDGEGRWVATVIVRINSGRLIRARLELKESRWRITKLGAREEEDEAERIIREHVQTAYFSTPLTRRPSSTRRD